MSWDVSLEIETDGEEPAEVFDAGNYTYNVAPMYYRAIGDEGLKTLQKMKAADALPILDRAIAYMVEHKTELEALNPSNGWGNYEGALAYLRKIQEGCRLMAEHPKAFIRIS